MSDTAVFWIRHQCALPAPHIETGRATGHIEGVPVGRLFDIVNEIESMAFYNGHYLAFGFAAGSCRHTFCSQQESCQAMEGKRCRISLRSRPSMEAVGIDVYKMAAAIGWDIYPIGSNAKPEEISKGTLAGIIIIQ